MTPTPWWQLVISIIGWSMLVGGMVVLVWALIGRRRRGQRCCPRCRYDMTGAPSVVVDGSPRWTCPECGRGITSNRQMHRRRRRRGWALFALLLMLGGYGAMVTHRCGVEGPRGLIPTLGLALAVRVVPIGDAAPRRWWPAPDDWTPPTILIDRINGGMMPAWQRRAVLYAALGRARMDLKRSPPCIPFMIELLAVVCLHSLPTIDEAKATDSIVAVWLETPPVGRVGTPVVAEVKCAGLGLRAVHVEIRSPWRADLVGAVLETTGGALARSMTNSSLWVYASPTVNLGVPMSEGRDVEIEMTIRRGGLRTLAIANEPVVAVGSTRLPIPILARDRFTLTPVDNMTPSARLSKVATINRPNWYRQDWSLDISDFSVPARPDVTVGARIEIYLYNAVYFTGQVVMWPGQPHLSYEWGTSRSVLSPVHSVRLHNRLPVPSGFTMATNWRLRLIGDEDVALQNPNATHYWRGVVDLPIMFDLDSPVNLPREP